MSTQKLRASAPLFLWAIIVVAVLLRCASALFQGETVSALPGIDDQISYSALARRVAAGEGFNFSINWWPVTRAGEPTAHWSFLYTLYLAALDVLVGPHPLAARLIQAIVAGILFPWLTWRLGRRLFGVPAGLIAAGLTAVYGYFVYYAGALMTETFCILAILWALDLAMQLVSTPAEQAVTGRARKWLLLGLALGVAVLLRQVVLLFAPVLYVWLGGVLVSRLDASRLADKLRAWKLVAGRLLLTTLVIAALIAPWTVRNYQVFGRFVLLNTNAGYAFFWANNPIYGTEFVPILDSGAYRSLIPDELRGLDEAALESALLQRGIEFVLADPLRYALLSLSRIKTYFEFWPSAGSSELSNVARSLSFGVYLPLMVYGLVASVLGRRTLVARGRYPELMLLYIFAGVYTLIHLLSWALVRYRLPVDAVLMPVAGLAVFDLASRLRAVRGRRLAELRWDAATSPGSLAGRKAD